MWGMPCSRSPTWPSKTWRPRGRPVSSPLRPPGDSREPVWPCARASPWTWRSRLPRSPRATRAMVEGKTAALLACSTYVGALAGARAWSSHEFGRSLGMAFQMVDDLLGIWGAEEKGAGKPVADDIRSGRRPSQSCTLWLRRRRRSARSWRPFSLKQSSSEGTCEHGILEDVGADGYVRERARIYARGTRTYLTPRASAAPRVIGFASLPSE